MRMRNFGAGAWVCLSLGGPASAVDQIPEIGPGAPAGYLAAAELPDSLKLLPRPPALGSAAEALDQDVARETLTLQGTARFKLAALDADLSFPNAAGTFACALGIAVTKDDTPTLYRLLRRPASDATDADAAAVVEVDDVQGVDGIGLGKRIVEANARMRSGDPLEQGRAMAAGA